MAGAIDLRAGSNSLSGQNLFQVDKSPLNQIFPGVDDVIGKQAGGTGNILVEIMAIPIDVLNTILDLFGLNPLNTSNSSSLGNDLGSLLKLPMTFLTDLLQLLGLGNGTSSSLASASGLAGIIGMVQPLVDMFVGFLGGSGTGNPLSVLQPLLGNIPLIGQLIGLFPNISSGLTGLTGLGSIFTDLTGLLGNPTSLGSGSPVLPGISSIPLLGGLLSGATLLTSLIPGLDASQIISGQFPASMISGLEAIGTDFISLVTSFIPGYSGSSQTQAQTDFASMAGNLMGLLGSPTGMLTTPVLPGVGSIPLLGPLLSGGSILSSLIPGLDASKIITGVFPAALLQPLIDAISTGYGGSSGLSFSGLQSFLAGLPLVGPLISAMLSAFNTVGGLSGTSGITSLFTDLSGLLGSPTSMGSGTPVLPGIGSIPLLGGLLSGGVTLLSSLIPGLDASKIITGQFPLSMITSLATLLGGFGTGTSIISQLLGLWPQAAAGLTGLGGLQSIYTDLMGLLGTPTGLGSGTPVLPGIGSIPVLGGLLSGGVTLLTSLIPGLDASKIITGSFPQSMISGLVTLLSGFAGSSSIISQLIGLFTGASGGLTGLGGLGSIFTDLTHLLGSPTALGSGTPLLPGISSIPLLGGLLSGATILTSLIPGLDASKIITGTFPQSMVTGLVDALANAGTNFAQLVASFIPGMSGGTQTDFTNIAQNMLAMLGNPTGLNAGSGFNPIQAGQQMLQQVLTPAGALTSLTQIPLHLFGNLASTQGQNTNLLANADPGFGSSTTLDGQGLWTWDGTVDHTGTAGSGSAKATASGVSIGLMSLPIAAQSNQPITASIYARWSGVSAGAGNAISVQVNAYDANDTPLGSGIAAAVTAPGAASTAYTGNVGGWVFLQGGYQTPTGTAYVRLSIQVGANMVAGTVWVDDLSLSTAGIVDATSLFNFENMSQGIIPGPAMAGFQGLVDIFASFAHLVDGLGTASSLTPQSGLDFSQLFAFIQDLSQNADQGGTQGAQNTNILNIRTNKSLAAGMHPTSEAMFPLTSFGTAGAMTTTSLAAGNAIGQPFRPAEVAQKGFVEFIASGSGLTNIFVNIFSVVPSTGVKTLLWGSTDQSGLVSTALGPVKVLIPGANQPTVNAGQPLLLEIVNAGSAALTVVTKNTGQPTHPTDWPYNIGTTRALASTGGASPSSLTDAQVTRTSNTPYINFGMQAVPNNFVPPQLQQFGGNGTWNRPAGFVDGDLVDYFLLGGGGGGQSGGYGLAGYGGQAGQWVTGTFVIGSDPNGTGFPILPNSTTSLAVGIGQGGGGGVNPYTLDPGRAGTATTLSGTGVTTRTAAGGLGGGNGFTGDGTSGQAAGNRTIGAYTAYGGPETAVNASGPGQPGAGGSSGYPAFGNDGGTGHAWLRTRQASSQ